MPDVSKQCYDYIYILYLIYIIYISNKKHVFNSHKYFGWKQRKYLWELKVCFLFKGTLIQIWKSGNIFVCYYMKIICWRFHIKTFFAF